MTATYLNYEYSYFRKGKPVFVPNEKCRDMGTALKDYLTARKLFSEIYCHLHDGGHVSALHIHRNNKYFAKVDIKNFYYSIARNRVKQTLKSFFKYKEAEELARLSCVKNPYHLNDKSMPSYSLPYGFVQSPILATLILKKSAIGQYIENLDEDIYATVYMDDITISSNDIDKLEIAFAGLFDAAKASSFTLNATKTVAPTTEMEVFNCNLENGSTTVTKERIAEFYSVTRSIPSQEGFEDYCIRVEN